MDPVTARARVSRVQDTVVHSHDLDEARDVGGRLYYPHQVRVADGSGKFGLRLDAVHLPRVTLGWISYDSEVTVTTGPLDTAYQVNVPSSGTLHTRSGDDAVTASPHRGAVYRPTRDSAFHGFAEPCRMLAVKIDRAFLEEELSTMLGRSVREPVDFELSLDLTTGRGMQWWGLASSSVGTVGGDQLTAHPTVGAALARSLAAGLLLAGDHAFRDELDHAVLGSAGASCPAAVRRAVHYIEERAAEPLTVIDIAAAAGVGVRALQHGFQSTLDTSPLRYLRSVRLERVRDGLLRADPERVGVADVAFGWGFTHLGRFAAAYREAYGESPSRTLRRGS